MAESEPTTSLRDLPYRSHAYNMALQQEVLKRAEERGYPKPILVGTVWGYKRADCPECHVDVLLEHYIQHYVRRHATRPNRSNVDKEPTAPRPWQRSMPDTPANRDRRTWAEKAKANHAAILAKYGKKMLK